jgi:ATP-dependent helicase/nuclease subunit A
MTEAPFTVLEESREPGQLPVLVRGVIDLLFEEEDGWVLVDYKTDAVDASQIAILVEKYSPQVRYYARTFSRLTQFPIKETFLYFTHPALSIPAR